MIYNSNYFLITQILSQLALNNNHMKKAVDRFWEWIFHPSVRWYRYKNKATVYRYPSPGSNANFEPVEDYREPYATSKYNIRYKRETPTQTQMYNSCLFADPISSVSAEERLIDLGYLKKAQASLPEAVEAAKTAYFKDFGVPVETKVKRNDFGIKVPEANSRDSCRYVVEMSLKSNIASLTYMGGRDMHSFYHMPLIEIESLDMFAGDPDYQQTQLEVTYKLDRYADAIAKESTIPISRGSRNFWKALDASNDPHNIENVQNAIGDSEPLNFKSLPDKPLELKKDKNGNIVDVV